jgi:hypothetical protein
MQTGMYLNSLICFLIFIFSFNTALFIYRRNKENYVDISYAAFWLFVSLTWLFVSFALLAHKSGFVHLDVLINQYAIQTLVFVQITAGIYYVIYRATNNNVIALIVLAIFIVLSGLGLSFNYRPGSLYLTLSTYCSTEYRIDETAKFFFQMEFIIVMLGMAIDFLKNLFFWYRQSGQFEQKYFFASLAALVYGMIGYFDNLGFSASWVTVFFRLAIIFCAHIAYLGYSEQEI